ncbi:hypothetical protein B0T25DRAFT_90214 [Lasiosphaeria hispida]|uniref:Uncharacterized protein n=1 Tax=Lasiosphaeria hispida TaxID=260671 RepID=A0AAJ0HQ65_9PEZI|nr:hypothetical protein B0T25DRAFT_90214 [Lasiosphaeria hispida]
MQRSSGTNLGSNPTEADWRALFESVASAEAAANDSDNGPSEIFNRFAVRAGERTDVIDPWVPLIPDSYDLSVINSAVAILLKMAQDKAEQRQEIFDAFIADRGTTGDASSQGIPFQSDASVRRRAPRLYEALVGAI